jgi:hypothetical protein
MRLFEAVLAPVALLLGDRPPQLIDDLRGRP